MALSYEVTPSSDGVGPETLVFDPLSGGRHGYCVSHWLYFSFAPPPPMQTSVPAPARSVSSPPPPTRQSLPLLPFSVSPAAVPRTRSLPLPPFKFVITVVRPMPAHCGGAMSWAPIVR